MFRITLLLLAFSTCTYAQGIQFFKGSWSQLLQTAKQQNKIIFVDVYTDWCGPCKEMDRSVFTAKLVGNKYNNGFLSYKLNAEKGEGIQLAEDFNVNGFPTFLYLNSRGDLLYRFSGFMEPDQLNAAADKAITINADSMTIGVMEADFKQGNREPVFMRNFIRRLRKLKLNNNQVMEVYYKSLSLQELAADSTISFFATNLSNTHTPVLGYIMEKYSTLGALVKKEITNSLYYVLVERGITDALKDNRLAEMKQLLTWADQLQGISEKQQWHKDKLWMVYAGAVRDVALIKTSGYRLTKGLPEISQDSARREDARRFAQFMEPFLKGEKDSTQFSTWNEELPYLKKLYSNDLASRLYFVAKTFFDLPDEEKTALKDALAWIKRARELDDLKVYGELVQKLEKRLAR
mgnify:CR=1 FL=1|jgi:Thiol:disulfide interchange protein